ncbi:MAG: AraC family transcriptional regulator [Pyrinomonadaceae bacterium]
MSKRTKKEQISVWRPNDVPGIELRSGTAVKEPYPRHWHEEYQFCFIQAGGGELFYRGAHHDTPQTSLFIVHPGEVHSNQTKTGCSFRSMYVDSELISKTIAGATGRAQSLPFFPNPLVLDREITSRYNTLHLSLEHSATTLERESLLLDLLTQLLARHAQDPFQPPTPKKARRAVAEVRDYIIEFHSRNISLQELAHLANLSPFYLTRIFAATVGMPPHAFQTQVRIARAKNLIRIGLPLSDVAALTGFADQSHFIRHFKHLMKITPGDYLNN